MIFFFSPSVPQLEGTPKAEIEAVVRALINASTQGSHYIIIGYDAIEWLITNIELGSLEKSRLTSIKQSISQRLSLKNDATAYVEISLGDQGLGLSNNNRHYTIGHKALLRGKYLSPATLLSENSSVDGYLFKEVMQVYRKKYGYPRLEMDLHMGGGSTIVQAFNIITNDNKIVIAVVDSDKAHPKADTSKTLKDIQKIENNIIYIGKALATPCRDIENFIPINFIKENNMCLNYTQHDMNYLEFLSTKHIDDIANCPLLHFDMKNGLNWGAINSLAAGSEEKEWYLSTYKNQNNEIIDFSIKGFGDGLISVLLSNNLLLNKFYELISVKSWADRFSSFFKNLLWYFFSDSKHSIT